MKRHKNKKINKKGFTLIELIIVITVLAILAGLALPKFLGVTKNSRVAAMQRDLDAIETAVNLYELEHNELPFKDLNEDGDITSLDKVSVSEKTLVDSLNKIGDDGSEVYKLDLDKLNNNLEKIKFKEDTYLYSTLTNTAINEQGKADGKDNIHHILNGGVAGDATSGSDTSTQTDETWNSILSATPQFTRSDVIETKDGGFVSVSGDGTTATIHKVDKNGKKLWENVDKNSEETSYYSVLELENGDFVVAGKIESATTGYDILLSVYSKNGDFVKEKIIAGNSMDYASAICKTTDGFVIGGYTSSSDIFENNPNKYGRVLFAKLDSDLNLSAYKIHGESSLNNLSQMIPTSDGGYIGVGTAQGTNGEYDGSEPKPLIVKFNKDGEEEWKDMKGVSAFNIGNVIEVSDGYVSVGAMQYRGPDPVFGAGTGQGVVDGFLIKYDKSGTLQWANRYGGSSDDRLYSVVQLNDGNYLAVGYTLTFPKSYVGQYEYGVNMYMVKIAPDGTELEYYAAGGGESDYMFDIIKTKSNNFVISGVSNSGSGDIPMPSSSEYYPVIMKIEKDGVFKPVANYTMEKDKYSEYKVGATQISALRTDLASEFNLEGYTFDGNPLTEIKIYSNCEIGLNPSNGYGGYGDPNKNLKEGGINSLAPFMAELTTTTIFIGQDEESIIIEFRNTNTKIGPVSFSVEILKDGTFKIKYKDVPNSTPAIGLTSVNSGVVINTDTIENGDMLVIKTKK